MKLSAMPASASTLPASFGGLVQNEVPRLGQRTQRFLGLFQESRTGVHMSVQGKVLRHAFRLPAQITWTASGPAAMLT